MGAICCLSPLGEGMKLAFGRDSLLQASSMILRTLCGRRQSFFRADSMTRVSTGRPDPPPRLGLEMATARWQTQKRVAGATPSRFRNPSDPAIGQIDRSHVAQDVLMQILADRVEGSRRTMSLEHRGRHVHRDVAQLADPRITVPGRGSASIHAFRQREGGGGEDPGLISRIWLTMALLPHAGEDEASLLPWPTRYPAPSKCTSLNVAAGGDDGAPRVPAGRCPPGSAPVGGGWGWEHHGALCRASISWMLLLEGATGAAGAEQHRDGYVACIWSAPPCPCSLPLGQQQARLGVAALVFVQPLPVVAHQPRVIPRM